MDAQSAYKHWKDSHKVNLRVYTDEQMFELGFNTCQTIIKEMSTIIEEMEKDAKKMMAEIKKLKKAKNETK
jgi:hypothetical protein